MQAKLTTAYSFAREADYDDLYERLGFSPEVVATFPDLNETLVGERIKPPLVEGLYGTQITRDVEHAVERVYEGREEKSIPNPRPMSPVGDDIIPLRAADLGGEVEGALDSSWDTFRYFDRLLSQFSAVRGPDEERALPSKAVSNVLDAIIATLKIGDSAKAVLALSRRINDCVFRVEEDLEGGLDWRGILAILMPQLFLGKVDDKYWSKRRYSVADIRMLVQMGVKFAATEKPLILPGSHYFSDDLGLNMIHGFNGMEVVSVYFRDKIIFIPVNFEQLNTLRFNIKRCLWLVCDETFETPDEKAVKVILAERNAQERIEAEIEAERLKVEAEKSGNTKLANDAGMGFWLGSGTMAVHAESMTAAFSESGARGAQTPGEAISLPEVDSRNQDLHLISYQAGVTLRAATQDLICETGYFEPTIEEMAWLINNYDLGGTEVVLVNGVVDEKNELSLVRYRDGKMEMSKIDFENEETFPPGTVFLVKVCK